MLITRHLTRLLRNLTLRIDMVEKKKVISGNNDKKIKNLVKLYNSSNLLLFYLIYYKNN